MADRGLQPSVVTLEARTWVAITVKVSTLLVPTTNLDKTGANARAPIALIHYWPGSAPPKNLQATLRSRGPGVCYLQGPVEDAFISDEELDQEDGQTWWLYYDSASADSIDLQKVPTRDTELATYSFGDHGWTQIVTDEVKDLSGGGVVTLANANPHRRYLLLMRTGAAGRTTIRYGANAPADRVGIMLNTQGSFVELFGDNVHKQQVRGIAAGHTGSSGDVYVLEGN